MMKKNFVIIFLLSFGISGIVKANEAVDKAQADYKTKCEINGITKKYANDGERDECLKLHDAFVAAETDAEKTAATTRTAAAATAPTTAAKKVRGGLMGPQCGNEPQGAQVREGITSLNMDDCLKTFGRYLEKDSYKDISASNLIYIYNQNDNKKEFAAAKKAEKLAKKKGAAPNAAAAAAITCGVTIEDGLEGIDDNFETKAKGCVIKAHILHASNRKWNTPEHTAQKNGASGNGIKCVNDGILTLDFEACEDFVNHAATAEVVQQVATTAQTMKYGMDMQDEQTKAMSSNNTATAALKGQKKSFEEQQNMAQQQAVMEGAKLAVLANDYSNMPSVEEVQSKCASITGNGLDISPDVCKAYVGQNSAAFLPNNSAKDKMKSKMIAIGGKAAVDLILADMLGKRAQQVGNAIATVDGFKPIPPVAPGMQDALATLCTVNPADPQCNAGSLNRTFGGDDGNNVVDFGSGGSGTVYSPGTVDPNSAAAGGTNAVGKVASKGSLGTNTNPLNQAGGLAGPAASAAQIETKAGSGGGGSGGGAGGGSGGGSGGGAGGGGTAGGATGSLAKSALYEGSGKGSLSMMGGFGINKPKGKTADTGNPFGKLFDKGKVDPNLNFRAPASSVGNKGDNLFQMITKRYNVVSSDKRLLEYEQAPTP